MRFLYIEKTSLKHDALIFIRNITMINIQNRCIFALPVFICIQVLSLLSNVAGMFLFCPALQNNSTPPTVGGVDFYLLHCQAYVARLELLHQGPPLCQTSDARDGAQYDLLSPTMN